MRTMTVIPALRDGARLAALLCLSLAAACTAPEGPVDAGTFSLSSLPCSTNAECSDYGFICDDVRRTCVCTSDEMCADKQGTPYCNAFTGHCVADVAGCKGDGECGDGEFCDVALRTCRDKKAYCGGCTQDAECGGPNDHCVKHPDFPGSPAFCASACTDTGGCALGQTCRDTEKGKQCVPTSGRCQGGEGALCNPDTGQSCFQDRSCTEGVDQMCDMGSNLCVAKDSGCKSGQACDPVTRSCVLACRDDAECQEQYGSAEKPYQCVRSTCMPVEICKGDGDCPTGKFCFKEPGEDGANDSGLCQLSCNANEDCPLGERCVQNPLTARNRCEPGCRTNSDCPLPSICTAGQCEYTNPLNNNQRCQVKEVCGFREFCSDQTCTAEAKHCQGSSNCGSGGTAIPIFFNAACGTTANITCPGGSVKRCDLYAAGCGGSGSFANACACAITRCVYSCANDASCPNGFYCAPTANGQRCTPLDASLCL